MIMPNRDDVWCCLFKHLRSETKTEFRFNADTISDTHHPSSDLHSESCSLGGVLASCSSQSHGALVEVHRQISINGLHVLRLTAAAFCVICDCVSVLTAFALQPGLFVVQKQWRKKIEKVVPHVSLF
jgi:hypothetical protein